jgi:hypothetical protein
MKRLIVDLPTFGHCAVLTVNRAYPVYPVLPTFSSAVGISQTVREPTSQLAVILCNQSGMVPIPKRRVADMAARSRICSLKQQRLGHVQLTPQPASRRGNGRRHRPECSPKPECSRAISPSPPSSSLERDFCRRRLACQKGLKSISPRRERKSETTTPEKWPQKRPFCLRAISCGFRKTGWWANQGSNLGPVN